MPKRTSTFTDYNLKLFYGNLLNHYKECTKRFGASNAETVYKELFLATQYAVESPQGSFSHLPRWEKEKVYTAFHTIFYALPLFTGLSVDKQRSFNPPRSSYNYLLNTSPQYIYNCTDSKLFNWVNLNENLNPSPYLISNETTKVEQPKSKHSTGFWAGVAFVTAVFSAAVLTLASWAYMFNQFINSAERLWYKEGWMRAALMSATALAWSAVASTLTLIFAAKPIVLVAIAMNFNPVSLLIISGICVASIAAGLGALSMNSIYDFVEKRSNKRSIDPAEPQRFALSEDEVDVLVEKQIDPIKVKCALVAIRIEMNRVLQSEEAIPSLVNRLFASKKHKETQVLLQKARALRRGELTEVTVGDLTFDCRYYEQLRQSESFTLGAIQRGLYPSLFTPELVPAHRATLSPPELRSPVALTA